jgi:hypothetical protein
VPHICENFVSAWNRHAIRKVAAINLRIVTPRWHHGLKLNSPVLWPSMNNIARRIASSEEFPGIALCFEFLDSPGLEHLSLPKTPSAGVAGCCRIRTPSRLMIAIAFLFVRSLCACFKSRPRLDAEILVLRHQLNLLRERAPYRPYLRWADRALFVWLYRRFPRILDVITIVRPETVVRWHRMGFAAYWRWKSRPRGGRPWISKEVRDLIRRMSFENPLWGAPKIHGELLKIGSGLRSSPSRSSPARRPFARLPSFPIVGNIVGTGSATATVKAATY